jgi:predicted lipoprotein with Yx(FWY)xxD motif
MDLDVSRRTLLRILAAGTVLTAGCAGGSSTPTPTESETPAATTSPTKTDSPTATPIETETGTTVQVRTHPDLGELLVAHDEMTLYMFDQDTKGSEASSCAGGCADSWPPLTVGAEPSKGDAVTGELSTFERDDDSTQLAANGWPLYYFTPDEEPGDTLGQGVNDVWWVLRPDGSPVRASGSPTATETPTGTPTEPPTESETPTETDSGY